MQKYGTSSSTLSGAIIKNLSVHLSVHGKTIYRIGAHKYLYAREHLREH